MPNTSRQHLAAMVPSVGAPFVIEPRSTPTPGPNEVLIEVKSVAVNPLDYFQRYTGFHIDVFPAIIGSDVGGTIIEVGSSVSLELKPGTRVSAFAPTFLLNGSPNYGAFQERVLVPDHFVTPLPNGRVSFNEASILPMALLTAWTGIVYQLGIPTSTTPYKPSDKQGLLIWSGASSVGTMVIQIAKLLGFTTYVTASKKSNTLMDDIDKAVKEDGVTVQLAYHTTGDLQDTLKVLQRVKGNGIAKVASAPALTEESPKTNDIEIGFVAPTSSGPKFDEVIDFVFRVWLKERLERAEFSPSPRVQVIGKGLGSLQLALEE
uniref:Enoyl reductase (ER) domain-containing protein n=1 Tax=Psilocybe cubensis TaxID=181762 RepID=A0A8H7XXI3_PSICU